MACYIKLWILIWIFSNQPNLECYTKHAKFLTVSLLAQLKFIGKPGHNEGRVTLFPQQYKEDQKLRCQELLKICYKVESATHCTIQLLFLESLISLWIMFHNVIFISPRCSSECASASSAACLGSIPDSTSSVRAACGGYRRYVISLYRIYQRTP